jgi:hypothetical protein
MQGNSTKTETGRNWGIIGAVFLSVAFFAEALFALFTTSITTYTESKIITFAVTYVLGFAALQMLVFNLVAARIAAMEKRLSELEKTQRP